MEPDFSRTFFITSVTWQRRALFQSDRNASFFLDVLFHYRDQNRFLVHEFVVMPDHFHLVITPGATISLERAMQFIKGGFSYRFKKEIGLAMEIWEKVSQTITFATFTTFTIIDGTFTSIPYAQDWRHPRSCIPTPLGIPDFASTPYPSG